MTTATKSNVKPKKKADLLGSPRTAGYQPTSTAWLRRPRDLPPLTWTMIEQMQMEPTIRLGLAMRAAPLMNAEFAYKNPGDKEWTEGIRAASDLVAKFVYRQMKRIWQDLDALLIAQIWGWAACEVVYHLTDVGTVEVSRLLPRHPKDTRALIRDGDICGVRFSRLQSCEGGQADLFFPKCIFHRHCPQSGSYYGTTILEGAYSPWFDKWGNGGALDVVRLTMQQNAINGRRGYYPDGSTDLPIGTGGETVSVPNRDIMRQELEQMLAGGVACFPSDMDEKGNQRWELKDATAMQGLQHVLQYPKDKDTEINRGLEIPDDVLSADNSGSWEGKKVPMMAFYGGLDRWLNGLKRDIVQQCVAPLVSLNFGKQWFEVETKPLAEQAMDAAKAAEPKQPSIFAGGWNRDGDGDGQRNDDQGPPRPPQTQRMSLDPVEAIGEGVLSAAEMVKAARQVLDSRGVIRMEAGDLSPPQHEFSSTQFNLTGDLAFQVRELGYRIDPDDLAEDGREDNPHITVKYGLHTNDAEQVRAALANMSPVAVQFGPASFFAGDKHDVVKIDVISKGLRELNAAIAEALPHTDTFPDYRPHVTIAYVKPGLGEKYAATLNDLEGRTAVFDRLTFSDKSRAHTSIPLTAKAIRFSAE